METENKEAEGIIESEDQLGVEDEDSSSSDTGSADADNNSTGDSDEDDSAPVAKNPHGEGYAPKKN